MPPVSALGNWCSRAPPTGVDAKLEIGRLVRMKLPIVLWVTLSLIGCTPVKETAPIEPYSRFSAFDHTRDPAPSTSQPVPTATATPNPVAATAAEPSHYAPPSTTPSVDELKSQLREGLAEPYGKGQRALERYRAASDCAGADRDTVKEMIEVLRIMVSAVHDQNIRDIEDTARVYHTGLTFDFADAALRRGCFDDADWGYRGLIEIYVGQAYGGIRDRARIGVDDVRAARAAADKKH